MNAFRLVDQSTVKRMDEKYIKETVSFALCNSRMEPVLVFSDENSMIGHMRRQKERHGAIPHGQLCKIVTTTQTEKIEWPPELE